MDGAYCDYGLFVGAAVDNAEILPNLSKQALALKMYLNETFTSLRLDSMETWMEVCYGRVMGVSVGQKVDTLHSYVY